jgi:hypothetical protein
MATPRTTDEIAQLNATLQGHNWGRNKFALGDGKTRPSMLATPAKDGVIQAVILDAVTGVPIVGVAGGGEKKPTFHLVTGVVRIVKQYADVANSLAQAKKKDEPNAELQIKQTIIIDMHPADDERLASSQPGLDALQEAFMPDLAAAMYDAKFEPTKQLRTAGTAEAYSEEFKRQMMDTSISPYCPWIETDDGDLHFKASYNVFPKGDMPRRPEHVNIAKSGPPEIQEFIETLPLSQRINFVDLIYADGTKVGPADYWDELDTSFGPGSLVILTLMVPYGGVSYFQGNKKVSIQPKLVSMQMVEVGEASGGGGGGGAPCNLTSALASYERKQLGDEPLDASRPKKKQKKGKAAE